MGPDTCQVEFTKGMAILPSNIIPYLKYLLYDLNIGSCTLPKTATGSRVAPNLDVFDFELALEDMKLVETDEYSPVV
jgi:hypothetical protein